MLVMLSKPKSATTKLVQVRSNIVHHCNSIMLLCSTNLIIINHILKWSFCLVDCEWDAFGSWSQCSASCGGGRQSRSRVIKVNATVGGQPCEGPKTQSRSCSSIPCPRKLSKLIFSFRASVLRDYDKPYMLVHQTSVSP